MEAPRSTHFDALEEDMRAMKEGVRVNQSFPVAHAENHLGQYQKKDQAAVASSKLQGYRASTDAMMSHNRRTERLLSPTRAQQPASKLQRPQVYRAGAENGSSGFPLAAADGMDGVDGAAGGGDSRDETIQKLNKMLRARNGTVKTLEDEINRYKGLVEYYSQKMTDIDSNAAVNDKRITDLADDLSRERDLHQKAMVEIEQQSQRLQEMEEASAAAHQANLELSRRLEEMNRHAQEQEEQRMEEAAAAAAAAAAAVAQEGANGGDGDGVQGLEELKEEVEKLNQTVKMKAKQLEAVQERASKTSTELQYYKGQARSGRFKSLLLRLWWLLRTVGYLGFILFVYVALSEDALRSRGVDVYRLAH